MKGSGRGIGEEGTAKREAEEVRANWTAERGV